MDRNNISDWNKFWEPPFSSGMDPREMVSNIENWDFEKYVHFDFLFKATANKNLRNVTSHKMDILEIGVGVGRIAKILKDHGQHICGVDWSLFTLCADRLYEFCNPRLICGPNYDFSGFYGESKFDIVYSILCFQHLQDEIFVNSYLKQAFHVLKTGGVFRVQNLISPPNTSLEPSFHGYTYKTANEFAEVIRSHVFVIEEVVSGLGHKDWSWITAVKLPT